MKLEEWLDYQQNHHPKSIDLGLERIGKVYTKLFPNGLNFKIITIAGTNGKGSTGNFLANIFNFANINYGWFSSPHIEKYNERFIVNNHQATDDEIISAFEQIERVRDNISLSYFEFSTLASFLIFANKEIEVAILEIGLGGRLDSVNIAPSNTSIITSIGFDHTEFLGDTIEKIAFEKAGIIKKNSIVFTPPNLPKIIEKQAQQQNSKNIVVNAYQKPLKMLGKWQQYNASLAKNCVQYLFDINEKIIDSALQKTTFIARAEIIAYKDKTFIFDTAHNPQAVKNLATLTPYDSIAIFASLGDKDINNMIQAITKKINIWYLLELEDSRGLKIDKLKAKFHQETIKILPNVDLILEDIFKQKQKNIIIFGSFLTIAAVKKAIS